VTYTQMYELINLITDLHWFASQPERVSDWAVLVPCCAYLVTFYLQNDTWFIVFCSFLCLVLREPVIPAQALQECNGGVMC